MVCPYPLTDINKDAMWRPVLPWGLGTRESPVGLTCRICVNVLFLFVIHKIMAIKKSPLRF